MMLEDLHCAFHDQRDHVEVQDARSANLRRKGRSRTWVSLSAAVRLQAAEALLARGGFHALSEHRGKVEHAVMSEEAMIARIRTLAGEFGIDLAVFLGRNHPKLIEAQPVEPAPEGASVG
jgi:hypothetical protein